MLCLHCNQPLKFITGEGHVHECGGLIAQRCDKCKWSGSGITPYLKCPNCGECGLKDDHCAEPERG